MSVASPPAGEDNVVVLREEVDVRVEGKVWVRTAHIIYRIDDASAIDAWGHFGLEFSPWTEETPVVAVRVLAPDGRVHDLDPRTITESVVGREADTYTDRRRLVAPLPAMQRSAIIERLVVTRSRPDSALPFERVSFTFGGPRTIASRLRLDAPAGSVVRSAEIGAPKPTLEKRAGRQIWSWVREELAAQKGEEPWSDARSIVPDGYVVASVDTTWGDVAAAYDAIVEEALRGFDGTAALAHDLSLRREALMRAPRDTRIQMILDAVGKRVRYTGLSLGDAAVIPRPPGVTLERRFGDCKDLATVVVGLLRAVDVQARVALVSTRLLPVLDAPGAAFDHAIVHVPQAGGDGELWLDATERGLKVGEIGGAIERRRALIAARATRALSTLPPTHGTYHEEREIKLAVRGVAAIVERSTASGAIAVVSRWGFTDEDNTRRKEELTKWTRDAWSIDEKEQVAVELGADLAEVIVRGRGRIGFSDPTAAVAYVPKGTLFDWLPLPLRDAGLENEKPPTARRTPLEGTMTFESKLVAHVLPPPGFEALPPPAPRSWRVGPVSFAESARVLPDGSVEVTAQVRQDALHVDPKDVDEVRRNVVALLHEDATAIRFSTHARALRERGDHRGAVRLALAAVATSPGDGLVQLRLGEELLEAGLVEAARSAARKATTSAPGEIEAWRLLARASEQGLLGVIFGFGADLATARTAHRKAIELDSNNGGSRVAAARALLHEPGGSIASDPAGGKQALVLLRAIPEERRTDEALDLIAQAAAVGNVLPELAGLLGSQTPYDVVRNTFFARGVEAGVAEAKARLSAAERERLLDFVSNTFLAARQYPEVEALLAHRGRASALGSALARCDPTPARPALANMRNGEAVVRGALLEITQPRATVEEVRRRWAVRVPMGPARKLTLDHERSSVLPTLANANLPGLFTCDILFGSLKTVVVLDHSEGQVLRLDMRSADTAVQATYVVARDGGELRLFEHDPKSVARFGEAALEAIERKNRLRAEFFVEAAGKLAVKPALRPPENASLETRAAYLALEGPGAAKAWRLLGPDQRRAVTKEALVAMLSAGDAAHAVEILEEYAKTSDNHSLVALAALDIGRLDLAEKEIALLPVNPHSRRTRAHLAFARGQTSEGARIEDELLADPSITDKAFRAAVLNDRAWRAVLGDDAAALDLARRAQLLEARPGIEHTLASAAAAAGRPRETVDALRRMIGSSDTLDGDALYPLARLAEEVGAREEAARLYEQAARLLPSSASSDSSSRTLVDRGLARLKKQLEP